jgi:hypothetical protein
VADRSESLLEDVGEGDLAAGEEAFDSLSLILAEVSLLSGGPGLVGLEGNCAVALGQGVVGIDVSLQSSLHFL